MEEQPKKRGLSIEQWAEARTRFEAGEFRTYAAVGVAYGVRRATVSKRGNDEGWIAYRGPKRTQPPTGGRTNAGADGRTDADLSDEDWEQSARTSKYAPKGTNWYAERDLYTTGSESYAEMAKRLGLNISSIERVACDREHPANAGKTWTEHRAEFREAVSGETLEREKEIQVLRTLTVNAQQRAMVADLVNEAFPHALSALKDGAIEPKERVKLALAALAMQRRIHGLDKAPVKATDPGKDAGAPEPDVVLEADIPNEVMAQAERALNALFGDDAAGGQSTP